MEIRKLNPEEWAGKQFHISYTTDGYLDVHPCSDGFVCTRKPFLQPQEKSFDDTCIEVAHIICKAALKYNIPLEVNISNIYENVFNRNKDLNLEEKIKKVSYPCKEFWKIVSEYEIKVLYGIDAHHKNQVLSFEKTKELANTIIGEEIINKLYFID